MAGEEDKIEDFGFEGLSSEFLIEEEVSDAEEKETTEIPPVEEVDDKIDSIEDTDEDEEEEEQQDEEEESSESDEKDEEPSVISTVIQKLGIEFDESELSDLEDTEDGIAELVVRAADKQAKSSFDKMLEQSPNAKALYDFEALGGDPSMFIQTFYPQTDFRQVQSVDEENVDMQKYLITESLATKGYSPDRIQRAMQSFEDSGSLFDEAKDSLADLQNQQEASRQQVQEFIVQERQRQEAESRELWNRVENTVQTGQLPNLPIPKAEQEKFMQYIMPPNENEPAPRDMAYSQMSLEEQLELDLVMYYGLAKVVKMLGGKVATNQTRKLRDKLNKTNDRGKNSSSDPNLSKPSNKGVDLDKIEFRLDDAE